MIELAGMAQEEPSPEGRVEAEKILRELDPLLGIVWMPIARQDKQGKWEGRYALTCTWPQVDKRWEMYRAGEIGEPFDVLGVFEHDASGVSWHRPGQPILDPMSVMDKAMEMLGKCDNTRTSWMERVKKSAEHNRELKRKRSKQVVDDTVYGMLQDRRLVTHAPLKQGVDIGADGLIVQGNPKETER